MKLNSIKIIDFHEEKKKTEKDKFKGAQVDEGTESHGHSDMRTKRLSEGSNTNKNGSRKSLSSAVHIHSVPISLLDSLRFYLLPV